jgi:pyruvate,water dikinase
MIPFCRTPTEGRKGLSEMKSNGFEHEIPANVILADEFLDVFDGFSIGSNDLTQLTLGLDRDSEIV